jgi:hypothetical protein
MAAGEHLGEPADMGGGGVQVGTGRQDLLEFHLFLVSGSSGWRSIQEVMWRTFGGLGVAGEFRTYE